MIPYQPEAGEGHFQMVKDVILKYHIGGVISKATHRKDHIEGMERLEAEIPWKLLVAVDAEWGIGMRFVDVKPLPMNYEVGDQLEEVATQCAQEVKGIGAHLNFAPVLDSNRAKFLYKRSFGSDLDEIKEKGQIFVEAHLKEGVIPTLKHFPGHGNVETDSHYGLPKLKSFDLLPFEIAKGRDDIAVMTAHLYVPDEGVITYSRKYVTGILRDEWGFDGLIVSDALNMKALGRGDVVRTCWAGHDVLLYGDHIAPNIEHILTELVPQDVEYLVDGVRNGVVEEEQIDASVRRLDRVVGR